MERCLLPLLLLKPVRCTECFRRDYHLIFVQVTDRPSQLSQMIPAGRNPREAGPPANHRNVA
jgi:hypothetical protein